MRTVKLNIQVLVECKKMAAGEASLSLEAKTSLFCAIFALDFTRQDAK